jgi:phosphoribosylformylglycinamidine cyclo-ligase
MTKNKYNYKDSGVNIEQGQKFVEDIKNLSSSSSNRYSIGGIGGFSGYVDIPDHINNPVYALACDGVGTKMKIAIQQNNLNTIGIDLVAMCVNDLIVSGAKPIAFLDYYGCSSLDRAKGEQIISGIIAGCELAECDLVGGETAEMPNHYIGDNFDLVGFSMGVNDKTKIIDGERISDGDVILGLPSSGFHSNGYSLINKIIGDNCNAELLEKLLVPTKIYVSEILDLLTVVEVHGMAHITGGGFEENLSRINTNFTMNIDRSKWNMPQVFKDIQVLGNLELEEMYKVFNCGIGYTVILNPDEAKKAKNLNANFIEIGHVSDEKDCGFKYI